MAVAVGACRGPAGPELPRATGYVEATEIRVAAKVAGRVKTVDVTEGARVTAGATVATLATTDVDFALQRARAERARAVADVRVVEAGARVEDVRQAEAQVAAAAADQNAAEAELVAARGDAARFEQLLQNRAGSQKQRDDAVARRDAARQAARRRR